MTYLESYEQCKTKEELIKKIKKDVHYAMFFNPDRITPIEKAMNIVAEKRGWDLDGISLK